MLGAGATALVSTFDAHGLGRVPLGGQLALRVPWSTTQLDPHDLHGPLEALFASAVADSVYGLDRRGRIYPTLADGFPTVDGEQTIIKLRSGLRTARGKPLTGRDLAWSVTRARKRGAIGLLATLTPFVRSDPNRPLIARFGKVHPAKLAAMLSSPLTALLPVGFDPARPDGTGALVASCSPARLELRRNLNAPRGPSFLERITVHAATDLADSLRAFEAGRDDLGWLGLGFHRNRPKARKFDYGEVGWIVLATGREAGRFNAPGMAQQLANGVAVERLGIGLPARLGAPGGTAWGGGPSQLLFDQHSGHLEAIAVAVATKLSQPGSEVTATGVSSARLRSVRTSASFTLALDVVRHPGGGPLGPMIALATADRPSLGEGTARKPPAGGFGRAAHLLTRKLRIGVLGGLAVSGGVLSDTVLARANDGRGIDWGGSYRGS